MIGHNRNLLVLLHIKQIVVKCILEAMFNLHLILLIGIGLKFGPLAQVEQQNGKLILDNPQQLLRHFILLTIFLVLEEYEMIY